MSTISIPITQPEQSFPEPTDLPVLEAIPEPPPDAGRDQVLQHVLELNERVIFYRESAENWKSELKDVQLQIDELKKQKTELESSMTGAKDTIREMQNAITDKLHSLAQGQTFMDFAKPGNRNNGEPFDPATQDGIELLGLTPSIMDKLLGAEVSTIADLEEKIRSGRLNYISGIGHAAVDKITDALLDYRDRNPVPDPDEGEE